ncbi:MAG: hypothetical protein ABSE43_12575 [Steroidobacteraceae bacterium]
MTRSDAGFLFEALARWPLLGPPAGHALGCVAINQNRATVAWPRAAVGPAQLSTQGWDNLMNCEFLIARWRTIGKGHWRELAAGILLGASAAGCVTAPTAQSPASLPARTGSGTLMWNHTGNSIPIEVRALDAEGRFLPVSAPGADATILLVFAHSPYGKGYGKGFQFPMAGRDTIFLRARRFEDLAASSASQAMVTGAVLASGLQIAPAETHIARVYLSLKTPLLPPSDLAFYNAITERRLLLIYFDRACSLRGTVTHSKARDFTAESWNVDVYGPGLLWIERKQNTDGTFTWTRALPAVVPMIIASPSVIDYAQTDVPGIALAAHNVRLIAARQGEWIAAGENCKVWNNVPKPNESATWSGACRGGIGEGPGVLLWQRDDAPESRDEVTLKRGMPTGPGSYTTPDGEHYEGSYVNGRSDGPGTITWPNGARFDGMFRDGVMSGYGVWTGPNGERYEGLFRNGARNGKGTAVNATGERYEGDWLDGVREGFGTQTYADGGRYEGQWLDDTPAGPGTRTWADGSRYSGDFVAGEPAHPELIIR